MVIYLLIVSRLSGFDHSLIFSGVGEGGVVVISSDLRFKEVLISLLYLSNKMSEGKYFRCYFLKRTAVIEIYPFLDLSEVFDLARCNSNSIKTKLIVLSSSCFSSERKCLKFFFVENYVPLFLIIFSEMKKRLSQ